MDTKGLKNIIQKKINFVANTDNLYTAINNVIKREMSDNEYMKDRSIMFKSKINQILYFSKNKRYREELVNNQNNVNNLTNFLEKYDYELFPEEWKNETIRLKTSIIENNVSNTDVACPNCGQKNAFAITKQLRSGDEGATTMFTCNECKHTWKEE